MGEDPPFHRRLVGHPRILLASGVENAARALLRAALTRDCRFSGSAAVHTIDEQLIGCIGKQRSPAVSERRGGGAFPLAMSGTSIGRSPYPYVAVQKDGCRLTRWKAPWCHSSFHFGTNADAPDWCNRGNTMQMFFFDMKDGVPLRDRVGIEFKTNAEAIAHCGELAQHFRDESLRDDQDLQISVVNASGREIHREFVHRQ
jgi:hypothetical protein